MAVTTYIPYSGKRAAIMSDTEGIGVPVHEQAGLDILTDGILKMKFANGEIGFRTFEAGQAFDAAVMQIYVTGSSPDMQVDVLLR